MHSQKSSSLYKRKKKKKRDLVTRDDSGIGTSSINRRKPLDDAIRSKDTSDLDSLRKKYADRSTSPDDTVTTRNRGADSDGDLQSDSAKRKIDSDRRRRDSDSGISRRKDLKRRRDSVDDGAEIAYSDDPAYFKRRLMDALEDFESGKVPVYDEAALDDDGDIEIEYSEGAYDVLTTMNYREKDRLFYKYYTPSSKRRDESLIAVMDTGVFAKSDYLRSHMAGSMDTVAGKDGAGYLGDIGDYHGTKVAGQAAYGSDEIKLLDIRVQAGQVGAKDNSVNIAKAMRSAIERGASILTCSVDIDWSKKALQEVLNDYPDVLVLTTAGNNNEPFAKRKVDGNSRVKRANAMLIGGVTLDGKKHPSRGYGKGVDVMVPSGSANDSERAMSVSVPDAVNFKEQAKDLRKKLEAQEKELAGAKKEHDDLKPDLGKAKADREIAKKAATDLKEDEKYKAAKQAVKDVVKKRRERKARMERATQKIEDINNELDWLAQKEDGTTTSSVGGESGVSFGIPVIANIAAKMKLINPALTGPQIRTILMTTVESNDDVANLSESGGMVDPAKAYAIAYRLRQ